MSANNTILAFEALDLSRKLTFEHNTESRSYRYLADKYDMSVTNVFRCVVIHLLPDKLKRQMRKGLMSFSAASELMSKIEEMIGILFDKRA